MSDNINDILKSLHSATAKELLLRVQSGEATKGDIENALKLLKDNNITVNVAGGTRTAEDLMKSMPFEEQEDAPIPFKRTAD